MDEIDEIEDGNMHVLPTLYYTNSVLYCIINSNVFLVLNHVHNNTHSFNNTVQNICASKHA